MMGLNFEFFMNLNGLTSLGVEDSMNCAIIGESSKSKETLKILPQLKEIQVYFSVMAMRFQSWILEW